MGYAYGTQGAPAVGNGLGGLPVRTVPATVVHPQDLYSGKKVRLVKVGAQTTVSSATNPLSNNGAPIPMGFGRFAIARSSSNISVVDYNSTGILQVRSAATVSGKTLSNAVFRGVDGNGYWYTTGTVLNRIAASGASGTANTALATVSTLAASGTITNGGAAYSALSLPASNRAVAKYGDNLIHIGTATVSAATKMVAVVVSLTSATVTAVFDLGAADTSNTPLQAVVVYKNILTLFWINQNTTTNQATIATLQFNLQNYQITNLTTATNLALTNAQSNELDPVAYACNGAVWVDMWITASGVGLIYNYGFATSESGQAINHVATVTGNFSTFQNNATGLNPSFGEYRTGSGRVKDFDYNLVYGYSSNESYEVASDIKSAETIMLESDYRFKAMARTRAPIAFMESSKRLPVSLSLVCAGTGDQTVALGSSSGYDALITYLDNGYWVLMATDGDGGVPNYTGYLQLYREA